ncbi:transglutaminase family protein [Pseudonocardia sp.]|uniref:transglutaminase family protein n=1 Tax=Pseudonocardia sp. TaxID=60912 RepID=UPI003D119907
MDAVARFTELVSAREPPLDRAALALAAGGLPRLDETRWLRELDRLAEGVTSRDALLERLFVQERFTGNAADYYDPRNSLLPHVLGRKLGIPITLAVVCIEVGRRAGITLHGVGMPGHFLVGAGSGDDAVLVDVFDRGRLLDAAGAEARFREIAGPDAPFGPQLLTPTSTRAILARMLENLRGIYRARRRPGDLEWVLRMRLALPGAGPAELVELVGALGDQAQWHEGAALLERHASSAEPQLQEHLLTLAKVQRAHLN